MIIIKTNIHSGSDELSYIIEGHAGYAEIGRDIICSAISCLHYSFLSWMKTNGIPFDHTDDGKIVGVSVIDKRAKDCYNMVVSGFEGVCEQYGKFVKIAYT